MSVYVRLCAISTCLSLATYALLAWLYSGFSLEVTGLLVLFSVWYGLCFVVYHWNRKRRPG
jgi:hypothetical protein